MVNSQLTTFRTLRQRDEMPQGDRTLVRKIGKRLRLSIYRIAPPC